MIRVIKESTIRKIRSNLSFAFIITLIIGFLFTPISTSELKAGPLVNQEKALTNIATADVKDIRVIRVVVNIEGVKVRGEIYRKDIKEALEAAGFKVVGEDADSYDATIYLNINQKALGREYYSGLHYSGARVTGEISFVLRNKKKVTLSVNEYERVKDEIITTYWTEETAPFRVAYSYSEIQRDTFFLLGRAGRVDSVINGLLSLKSSLVPLNAAKTLDILQWEPETLEETISYLIAKKDFQALIKIGQPAVGPLIRVLSHSSWSTRSFAAEALGKIGDKRAVEPLIKALNDNYSDIRRSAAEALGKIGDKKAVEPLIKALGDSDLGVCLSARKALAQTGQPAVEPLIKALRDSPSNIRSSATKALVQIGQPAVEPLIKALRDSPSNIRPSATRALVEIGQPAVEPLIKALRDSDERIRFSAAKTLDILHWQPETLEETISYLIAKKDWQALGGIGDKRAVEPLIKALNDSDEYVRPSAAEALGKIGDKRAVEPLIKALSDSDKYVRSSAAKALGPLKDSRAVDSLIKALQDEDRDVRFSAAKTLVQIGQPSVQPLVEFLDHHWDSDVASVLNQIDPIAYYREAWKKHWILYSSIFFVAGGGLLIAFIHKIKKII